MTFSEALDIIRKSAQGLGGQFDHVQILVSWDEGGETYSGKAGQGNDYARRGMAQAFLDGERDQHQADCIASSISSMEQKA